MTRVISTWPGRAAKLLTAASSFAGSYGLPLGREGTQGQGGGKGAAEALVIYAGRPSQC